jgi:hypothetical protein
VARRQVGLGREHVEANAREVPGIEVSDRGVGVEEGAAGDVDEPGAKAHGSKHGVVDEGRLAGLMTGRDDDRVGVGDAVEEAVGGVDGSEGGTGPSGEWRRTPVTVTSNAARRRAIWVPNVLEIYGMLPQEARPTNPPARVWIPVPLPLPSCPVI